MSCYILFDTHHERKGMFSLDFPLALSLSLSFVLSLLFSPDVRNEIELLSSI